MITSINTFRLFTNSSLCTMQLFQKVVWLTESPYLFDTLSVACYFYGTGVRERTAVTIWFIESMLWCVTLRHLGLNVHFSLKLSCFYINSPKFLLEIMIRKIFIWLCICKSIWVQHSLYSCNSIAAPPPAHLYLQYNWSFIILIFFLNC